MVVRTINFIFQHQGRRYGKKSAQIVLEDNDNGKKVKDAVKLLHDRNIPIKHWDTSAVKVLCSVPASERLDCNGMSSVLGEDDMLHWSLSSDTYVVVVPKCDEIVVIAEETGEGTVELISQELQKKGDEDEDSYDFVSNMIPYNTKSRGSTSNTSSNNTKEAVCGASQSSPRRAKASANESMDSLVTISGASRIYHRSNHVSVGMCRELPSSLEGTAMDNDDAETPAPLSMSDDTTQSDDTNNTSTTTPSTEQSSNSSDIETLAVKVALASMEDLCQITLKKDKNNVLMDRLFELCNNESMHSLVARAAMDRLFELCNNESMDSLVARAARRSAASFRQASTSLNDEVSVTAISERNFDEIVVIAEETDSTVEVISQEPQKKGGEDEDSCDFVTNTIRYNTKSRGSTSNISSINTKEAASAAVASQSSPRRANASANEFMDCLIDIGAARIHHRLNHVSVGMRHELPSSLLEGTAMDNDDAETPAASAKAKNFQASANPSTNETMGDAGKSAIGGNQNIGGETNKETAVPQSNLEHATDITQGNHIQKPEASNPRHRTQTTCFDVVVFPGPLGIVVASDGPLGIRVESISEKSQCKGKIECGDWIVKLDGLPLHNTTMDDFVKYLKEKAGVQKTLTVHTRLEESPTLSGRSTGRQASTSLNDRVSATAISERNFAVGSKHFVKVVYSLRGVEYPVEIRKLITQTGKFQCQYIDYRREPPFTTTKDELLEATAEREIKYQLIRALAVEIDRKEEELRNKEQERTNSKVISSNERQKRIGISPKANANQNAGVEATAKLPVMNANAARPTSFPNTSVNPSRASTANRSVMNASMNVNASSFPNRSVNPSNAWNLTANANANTYAPLFNSQAAQQAMRMPLLAQQQLHRPHPTTNTMQGNYYGQHATDGRTAALLSGMMTNPATAQTNSMLAQPETSAGPKKRARECLDVGITTPERAAKKKEGGEIAKRCIPVAESLKGVVADTGEVEDMTAVYIDLTMQDGTAVDVTGSVSTAAGATSDQAATASEAESTSSAQDMEIDATDDVDNVDASLDSKPAAAAIPLHQDNVSNAVAAAATPVGETIEHVAVSSNLANKPPDTDVGMQDPSDAVETQLRENCETPQKAQSSPRTKPERAANKKQATKTPSPAKRIVESESVTKNKDTPTFVREEPAGKDFPEGWVIHSHRRKVGKHVDIYHFTKTGKKLRSKPEAKRFLDYLEVAEGDEDIAYKYVKTGKRPRTAKTSAKG